MMRTKSASTGGRAFDGLRRAQAFKLRRGASLALSLATGATTLGQVQVYSDRAAFLSATGAQAEPAWPNAGLLPGGGAASYHLGQLTLSVAAPSSGLYVGSGNVPAVGPDWTTLVAGNDIAISGPENLNVAFDRPMSAFGFDFAEPTTVTVVYNPCSGICPCANSTFHVTLRLGGVEVGALDYNRLDNTAAFVGIVSGVAFDLAEIREIGGTCDDEYFGQMYTLGCAAPTISSGPANTSVCTTGTSGFTVDASGAQPFTYMWQLEAGAGNWINAVNGALPYNGGTIIADGVTTGHLSLDVNAVHGAPGINFRCIVTGTGNCGSATSEAARLYIDPSDVGSQGGVPGRDGVHDNNDFIVYIDMFFNGQPSADLGVQGGVLGSDGQFDNNDFVVYIDQFFAGC